MIKVYPNNCKAQLINGKAHVVLASPKLGRKVQGLFNRLKAQQQRRLEEKQRKWDFDFQPSYSGRGAHLRPLQLTHGVVEWMAEDASERYELEEPNDAKHILHSQPSTPRFGCQSFAEERVSHELMVPRAALTQELPTFTTASDSFATQVQGSCQDMKPRCRLPSQSGDFVVTAATSTIDSAVQNFEGLQSEI